MLCSDNWATAVAQVILLDAPQACNVLNATLKERPYFLTFLFFFATGDTTVRCEQLDMLQDWLSEFRKSTSSSSTANPEELVAFDVICGDLNFDNCSSGKISFAFSLCVPNPTWNSRVLDMFILDMFILWVIAVY